MNANVIAIQQLAKANIKHHSPPVKTDCDIKVSSYTVKTACGVELMEVITMESIKIPMPKALVA